MPLADAKPRPSRNPKYLLCRDGRYFARLVVPPELRPFLDGDAKGRTELRTPLGPDRRTALQRLHPAVAAIQHRIAQAERRHAEATRQPLPIAPRYRLSDDDAALRVYEARLATDDAARDRSPAYALGGVDGAWMDRLRLGTAGALEDEELDELVGITIRQLAEGGAVAAEEGTPEWRRLARLLCRSMLEAATRKLERDAGNFTGLPSIPALQPRPAAPEPLPLKPLFLDYVADRQRVGKGRNLDRTWGPVIANLVSFVGHDDALRITKRDIMAWRDKLLADRSPRTVRFRYLAPVRSLYNWAKLEDRLDFNPADGVRQPMPKEVRSRERGYTEPEARAVIAHSLAYRAGPAEFPETAAAKRWIPLLCAHTGARVTELTQARKEDVREEGEHYVLRITPDAGTVKSGGFRDVPLHPELIDLGFLAFVNAAKSGPLFYRAAKGQPSRAKAQKAADAVGRFLQAADLVPEGVSPNHGARHAFKTRARELGLSDRIIDAVCGHSPKTVGDAYGDATIIAKARVIEQMPRLAA